MAESRWMKLTTTFPGGDPVYVCQSCGRVAANPDESCPRPAEVSFDGMKVFIPCDRWPLSPEEFQEALQKAEESKKCLFTGTIALSDGTRVEVTAPVSEKLAREIVTVDAEIKLGEKARQEVAEKIRNDAGPTLGQSYQARFQQHYDKYLAQAKDMGAQMAQDYRRELSRQQAKLGVGPGHQGIIGSPIAGLPAGQLRALYGEHSLQPVNPQTFIMDDNVKMRDEIDALEKAFEAHKEMESEAKVKEISQLQAALPEEPETEESSKYSFRKYYETIIGGKKK